MNDKPREALIKSAAVDGERFFVKTRFEKRWNTVCISRFSNRRIGGKDPSSAVGDLFRGSQDTRRNKEAGHKNICIPCREKQGLPFPPSIVQKPSVSFHNPGHPADTARRSSGNRRRRPRRFPCSGTVRFHPSPQSEAVSGRRRPEHFKGISENRRSPFYFSHTHTAPPGCGSEADVSDASPRLKICLLAVKMFILQRESIVCALVDRQNKQI